jgi:hypothetical protein
MNLPPFAIVLADAGILERFRSYNLLFRSKILITGWSNTHADHGFRGPIEGFTVNLNRSTFLDDLNITSLSRLPNGFH